MIELKILDACENCEMFIPTLANDFIMTNLKGDRIHHTVTCEYIKRCRTLLENLQKKTTEKSD